MLAVPRLLVRAVLLGSLLVVLASVAQASAASLTVRGTISCDTGDAVTGIWLQSTGGGSGWITDRQVYPGRGNVAIYHKTITTTLPTKLRLDVGCGGRADAWRSNNRSTSLTVSSTSSSINLWCSGSPSLPSYGTCRTPNRASTAGAPGSNPAAGLCWCTWRAADFWKSMVGAFPNWGGNAAQWDENAGAKQWSVSTVARPRALVTMPTTDPAGHVGYVSDVRVSSGKVQMMMSDRNWNASCRDGTQPVYDRTNVWVDVSTAMRFIVAPPAT